MEERLEKIPDSKGLYYDKYTGVVYYVSRNLIDHSWCITAMTPYLGGKYGRPCYYDEDAKRIREYSPED